MNKKHKKYKLYKEAISDLYEEYHMLGYEIPDDLFIGTLKYYNVYDWYVSEKLKEKRKDKLKILRKS